MTEKWTQLFASVTRAAQSETFESPYLSDVANLLYSLNLVQPFDWSHWGVPFEEPKDLWQLDINDCIRHITRIVRSDRFCEGNLHLATRSGTVAKLCLVAFERTGGKRAPKLKEVVAN